MQTLKIGTRTSPLAMAQAKEVQSRLAAAFPDVATEIVGMNTRGDTFIGQPLAEIGGKGLFTKEIEDALLDGRIDLAVHSMKDVPTVLPEGLIMGAILPREDARDYLVGSWHSLAELPKGAKFGTSSLRRAAQVLMVRPDIEIVPLRGNVQTRLKKLGEGLMDATMLAQAGLNRLGLAQVPGAPLEISECLPAIAQGAIGIECRENDEALREKLALINCKNSFIATECERAFLRVLDGSCRTPIAGHAQIHGQELHFSGLLVEPDGKNPKTVEITGSVADAAVLGRQAGQKLKA
jgi:hydroxymethylbilane synthase